MDATLPRRPNRPTRVNQLVNLTGNPVHLIGGPNHFTLPALDRVCRAKTRIEPLFFIEGVGVIRRTPLGLTGLPSPFDRPDEFYIVPNVVQASNPQDPRLFSLNRARQRDVDGVVYTSELVGN